MVEGSNSPKVDSVGFSLGETTYGRWLGLSCSEDQRSIYASSILDDFSEAASQGVFQIRDQDHWEHHFGYIYDWLFRHQEEYKLFLDKYGVDGVAVPIQEAVYDVMVDTTQSHDRRQSAFRFFLARAAQILIPTVQKNSRLHKEIMQSGTTFEELLTDPEPVHRLFADYYQKREIDPNANLVSHAMNMRIKTHDCQSSEELRARILAYHQTQIDRLVLLDDILDVADELAEVDRFCQVFFQHVEGSYKVGVNDLIQAVDQNWSSIGPEVEAYISSRETMLDSVNFSRAVAYGFLKKVGISPSRNNVIILAGQIDRIIGHHRHGMQQLLLVWQEERFHAFADDRRLHRRYIRHFATPGQEKIQREDENSDNLDVEPEEAKDNSAEIQTQVHRVIKRDLQLACENQPLPLDRLLLDSLIYYFYHLSDYIQGSVKHNTCGLRLTRKLNQYISSKLDIPVTLVNTGLYRQVLEDFSLGDWPKRSSNAARVIMECIGNSTESIGSGHDGLGRSEVFFLASTQAVTVDDDIDMAIPVSLNKRLEKINEEKTRRMAGVSVDRNFAQLFTDCLDSDAYPWISEDNRVVLIGQERVEQPTHVHAWSEEDAISLISNKNMVEGFLNSLHDADKRIIELRYGLIDGIERTLAEVAEIMGVTPESIKQKSTKIMKSLREQWRQSNKQL